MFCPKCGKENPDTKQFCGECGVPLIKRVSPDTQQNNTQKKTEYAPSAGMIVIGLFIILAMYLFPLPNQSIFGGTFTLAKTIELCSSPFPMIRCNSTLSWIFYLGWIVGVIFIVLGICNKKETWVFKQK